MRGPLLCLLLLRAAAPAATPWRVARQPDLPGAIPYFRASNCDKDGAAVAARAASALGGVADTRALALDPSARFADAAYLGDVAAATAALFAALPAPLLNASGPLVVASVHRAALWAAEALHAPLLPAQALAFALTLEQACAAAGNGSAYVLLGADYGFDGGWLWLKPRTPAGVPAAHRAALARAASLLLLRATDEDEYLGGFDCGGGGVLAIHPSLKAFAAQPGYPRAAALWQRIQAAGGPAPLPEAAALRQWEWGLPDGTIAAYRAAWAALGRPAAAVAVVEGGVVDGYLAVPRLWRAYLAKNGVAPRGITLESYWVAQPALARRDGVLPFPSYALYKPEWHPIASAAQAALAAIAAGAAGAAGAATHTRAFVNGVGSDTDRAGARALLAAALGPAAAAAAECVFGLDCPPAPAAACGNASAPAPPAHAAAAAALANAAALLPPQAFVPLTVDEALAALLPFGALK